LFGLRVLQWINEFPLRRHPAHRRADSVLLRQSAGEDFELKPARPYRAAELANYKLLL
jgi:hypothetical protein